jgi:hypothetical protein
MCQSLVDKVARSRQLMAVAHPEVLTLFENWLEELEEEVIRLAAGQTADAAAVAGATGLSRAGAEFILAKLTRDGLL